MNMLDRPRAACGSRPRFSSGMWALVLAWDGEPVPEGLCRAAIRGNIPPSAVLSAAVGWLQGDPVQDSVTALGTIVLLDANGQEVTRD